MSYQRLRTDNEYVKRIQKRTQIIKLVREFFDRQAFLEVQTPLCVRLPGMEPYLYPFKTFVEDVSGKKHEAYLITSPEYAMKKLLVGGLQNIYQLGPCFRNHEAWGGRHNPEFTLLEWYRAGGDYNAMISDTINLMKSICQSINGTNRFIYQGQEFDLDDIEVLTVADSMKQYAQINLDDVLDYDSLQKVCEERGYVADKGVQVIASETWDDLFFKIFITEVEPHLGHKQVTVLKDYPTQLAALAKQKKSDNRYAERFEIYCGGLELCNGFSELIDTKEQRERFKEEWLVRKNLGKDLYDIDETFLDALELGMPDAGGNALGVDRLVMLFTNAKRIEDVLLFPAGDIWHV